MTSSWRELCRLYWVRFRAYMVHTKEESRVILRYYRNMRFAKIDLMLYLFHFFKNPYRISCIFLQKRGEENVYQYGETPLTTMETIVKRFGVQKGDGVMELGCGRGRVAFWLHAYWGCRVWGVEEVGSFVKDADKIVSRFGLKDVHIVQGDLLQVEFPKNYQWIYLYGSSWSEEVLRALVKKLENWEGSVISVSFPISIYDEMGSFQVVEEMEAEFLWGTTTVYLSKKRGRERERS